jgi:hypothetical protein
MTTTMRSAAIMMMTTMQAATTRAAGTMTIPGAVTAMTMKTKPIWSAGSRRLKKPSQAWRRS